VIRLIGIPANEAELYSGLITGVFALSVLTFVVDIASSILSGLGRIDLYNYSQLVTQSVSVLGSVIALGCGYQLSGLLAAQLTGYLSGLTFSLVLVRQNLGHWPLKVGSCSRAHLRKLLGEGSLLAGSWIMSLMFHPVNKILLAQAGFFADLPIYEISVNLSMRLRNLFESGQRALMPETSRLVASAHEPRQAISSLIRSSIKGLVLFATPIYAFILIFAGPLTKIWLRHSFTPDVPSTLRVFLLGTFVSLLGTPLYYALIGMGNARFVLIANAVQISLGSAGVFWILHGGFLQHSWRLAQVLSMADLALAASTTVLLLAAVRSIRSLTSRVHLAQVAA
jgi:O-antigen/teichoic acid export membrane protein